MLTPTQIEQEILKYAEKKINEDNPKIITYEFNFKYKRSNIVKTEEGWINKSNSNRYKNDRKQSTR